MAQISSINSSAQMGAAMLSAAHGLRQVRAQLTALDGPRGELAATVPAFQSMFGVTDEAGAIALRDRIPGVLVLLSNTNLSGADVTKAQILEYIANLRDFMNATLPTGV